jgi:hypothetical protein
LVVNASYLFQQTGWSAGAILAHPEPSSPHTEEVEGVATEAYSPVSHLPAWMPVPLPYPFVFGAATIRAQHEAGHGGRLFGLKTMTPAYFPVLLVVKTPAAILALLACAAVATRRWLRYRRALTSPLLIVPFVLLLALLPSRIQIGVRHALPIVPFLLLPASLAALALAQRRPLWTAGLGLLLIAELAITHPRHISHFSWLIGGPAVGHRVNIVGEDWGQDVGRFGRFAEERGLFPLHYVPYGHITPLELAATGVPFEKAGCRPGNHPRGPGWLAVHAAKLVRREKPCGPIPVGATPDAVFEHHIFVFRLPD